MRAVVIQKAGKITFKDVELNETLGPKDVRIGVKAVGICGSDIHYYEHGAIGPFVIKEPMIPGHEASGEVIEVGSDVTKLKVGDRVCMEPAVADAESRASREGFYNLDPDIVCWSTPPYHGCLRPEVVHPENYCFKLPDNVSYEEGAMVEPLAVGMHSCTSAGIKPGDTAAVLGAGPIGLVTAMSAVASGCSHIVLGEKLEPKLNLAQSLNLPLTTVNVEKESMKEAVDELTSGWGVNHVFEASGDEKVYDMLVELLCPKGKLIAAGMPVRPVYFDIVSAQVKEVTILTGFRYCHDFPKAVKLMGSGNIDVKPLISKKYKFDESLEAFEEAVAGKPENVKILIVF